MLKDEWLKKKELVEDYLMLALKEKTPLEDTLRESMEYSLMAGGKRLRPVLLMATAEAFGEEGAKFLPIASAMEMIHTYSLIHDDLPAMDNDDYRRGKLTNHKKYGDAIAILAGDALLTLAFEVIARQKDVSSDTILMIYREITDAAGAYGMVGGQALDLKAEGKNISLDELRALHMGKTGALFRAAIRSGAMLAKCDQKQLKALTVYAENFGLAFQITDDILDVIGDEKVVGKPIGSDERNHKQTYVTLTSLEEAQKLADEAVESAIEALDIFDSKADFLREMVRFISNRNV